MSTPFQNRLVGTVIVAAVAIIFLPDLLDGDKKSYQAEFDQIPTPPEVTTQSTSKVFPQSKLNKPVKDEIIEDVEPQDSLLSNDATPSDSNNREQIKEKKADTNVKVQALKKEKLEEPVKSAEISTEEKMPEKALAQQAWVIQLGSFKHKKNVADLVNKLKANGYNAFTKPIKTRNGTLTKVFVGPELTKSTLEKKIPSLKKLTQVEGKIARYSPTNT